MKLGECRTRHSLNDGPHVMGSAKRGGRFFFAIPSPPLLSTPVSFSPLSYDEGRIVKLSLLTPPTLPSQREIFFFSGQDRFYGF